MTLRKSVSICAFFLQISLQKFRLDESIIISHYFSSPSVSSVLILNLRAGRGGDIQSDAEVPTVKALSIWSSKLLVVYLYLEFKFNKSAKSSYKSDQAKRVLPKVHGAEGYRLLWLGLTSATKRNC